MSMDLRMCTEQDIERIGERVRHDLRVRLLLHQLTFDEFCRLADAWLESVRVWINARNQMIEEGYIDGLS